MRALLAAAALVLAAAPASAQSLGLRVGEARAITLPGWATGIVVGSPAIIEVAVHDNQTILVTGKSQGVTSLLAIDTSGQTLVLSDIQVMQGNDAGQVTVSAARRQHTYACMTRCEPTVAIGDAADFTSATAASITQRLTGGRP